MNFDFIKEYGKYRGLYIITNNINGHKYIGQTMNSFKGRYSAHKYGCFCNKNSKGYRQSKFYNSLRKYGWQNFSFDILHFCDDSKGMDDLEKYYIAHFGTLQNGLNTSMGGHSGKIHSESSKKKMSEIKKNQSSETRMKISRALTGRKHSKESREKCLSRIRVKRHLGKGVLLPNNRLEKV